ncbi:MAG: hypothetical protein Q4D16_20005 [Eubacteriales bacterium]|nr:hypothetical protein [Eubacteriales bacterium]
MRKKQLFALLLTGALSVGMVPAAAYAADASALSIEGEAASEEGGGDISSEPTDTPEEGGQQDGGNEGGQDDNGGEATPTPEDPTPAEPTPTEEPQQTPPPEEQEGNLPETKEGAVTPTPEVLQAGNGTVFIDQTSYASLAAAFAAVPDSTDTTAQPTKIVISGDLEISGTIDVPANKNILVAAATAGTTISRADGFTGDMFSVSGGTLQLGANSGTGEGDAAVPAGNLTVNGTTDGTNPVEGTIVAVTGGTFALLDNVTLTGSITSGNGGAVRNTAGTVVLMGGTITGNTAAQGGAVYSEGVIGIQGTVKVKENKKSDAITESNITLKGAGVINITGALADSELGVAVLEGQEGAPVVQIPDGVEGVDLAAVLAQITYEGEGFALDENGKLKSTEITPTPTPAVALELKGVSYEWTSPSSVKIVCVSNKDGYYYVDWTTRGGKAPIFDLEKDGVEIKADRNFTIYLSDLPTDKAIDAYVCIKDKDNTESKKMLFQLDEGKRPTPTPTPVSREPLVPKVTESVVQGLENALEFYPNTFYEFTVIGAGTDNNDPIQGDVKWVPLYWSTSSNPSASARHTTWKIGSQAGIRDASTYNLYIFFQKWEYDGNDWQQTDTVESAVYKFKAKAITYATATPKVSQPGQQGTGGGGDDENGAENKTADGDTTGASKTGAVSTADESPIGSMMALAAASLLAGGYVLVRRRKKVND